MSGVLYLVPTPIGNYGDITLRALEVLKSVDIIIGEEFKEVRRMLKHYGIEKPIELINEHNEKEESEKIVRLLVENRKIALVSDAGTPLISDPGRLLVQKVISQKIKLIPLPGASSILPALIVSGFNINNFIFVGWLSPKKDRRRKELQNLMNEHRTMVLMETPYRLKQLLRDMSTIFKDRRYLCISFNLTMQDEEIFRGTAVDLYKCILNRNLKGEFVVVIEGMEKKLYGK